MVVCGVKMGRKPKLTPQQVAYARKLIEQGEHHNTVVQSLNVSRRTPYQALQKYLMKRELITKDG